MLRTMRLTVFSFTLACSCAIPRPDTYDCIANAPAENMKCYNMQKDYDENGNLNSGAVPTYFPLKTINDVNKSLVIPFDGDGHDIANLKSYIEEMRKEYQNQCGGQ